MASSRRRFLSSVSGAFALVGTAPKLPSMMLRAAEQHAKNNERILVVVQLSGGNDGVNTVIPYRDDAYFANRFTLAIGRDDALKVNDDLGLHPSMGGFARLLEDGKLSILNGVGYPNPNRSHFESMDLWHTAHRERSTLPEGWLGQWVQGTGRELGGLHLGDGSLPLALQAADLRVPSVRSFDEFRLRVRGQDERRKLIHSLVGEQALEGEESSLLSFVRSSTKTALSTSERMEDVSKRVHTDVRFPGSRLGKKLESVARMIRAELPTRVFYVTLDGFDTHSKQKDAHAGLLAQLSEAAAAFIDEMAAIGAGDRVLLFAFSEFGRRLKENASQGTDHGAAAPVFLAGDAVKPGPLGAYPSLTDLVDGDLKFHTDYRSVYATLIEDWLGGNSTAVLGESFPKVDCFEV